MNSIQNCMSSFVKAAESVEYSWSNPKALVVLVPFFSLVVQEIKANSIKKDITAKKYAEEDVSEMLGREGPLAIIHKWHGIGAAVHVFVLAFFVQSCPLLIIPVALGTYQVCKYFMDSQSITIKIDGKQGTIKRES